VDPVTTIDGTGGTDPVSNQPGGSAIELVARRPMQLGGSSKYKAPPGGSVTLTHPPGANPVLGSSITFNPDAIDHPLTDGPYPNCPVCGDGIRQFGEVCDKGPAAQGSCCNATCSAFTCPTPTVTATP